MAAMKVKVALGTKMVEVTVKESDCFGDVKQLAKRALGLDAKTNLLVLFRGREMRDGDAIYARGVRSGAKLVLREMASAKRAAVAADAAQARADSANSVGASPGMQAIARIRTEVDSLASDVRAATEAARGGSPVPQQRLIGLAEYCTQAMLKLDGVDAGDDDAVRTNRKEQVKRLQALCEQHDTLQRGES